MPHPVMPAAIASQRYGDSRGVAGHREQPDRQGQETRDHREPVTGAPQRHHRNSGHRDHAHRARGQQDAGIERRHLPKRSCA